MNNSRIILASASPRRRELLLGIGLPFEVAPSEVEEISLPGERPQDQVRRLALEKAQDVAKRFPEAWVLGADTIVVIDKTILGKPNSTDEACYMLNTLAGRTHEVYTGYTIMRKSGLDQPLVNHVRSLVHIRKLSDQEISDYVASGEPMDKAGSYAIQGLGAAIVRKVEGSYTNVVGLPLCEVAKHLKDLGIFDFLGAKNKG